MADALRTKRVSSVLFAALASLALAACGIGDLGLGGASGSSGGGGPLPGPGPGNAEQLHNLDEINRYRAMVGAPALVLDAQLNDFAAAGSQQLMQDHSPHAHFIAHGSTLFTTDGFVGSAGENQGDPNGWPARPSVNDQIDEILAFMWAEGPGSGAAHGHYENMANPAFRRVGVGLVLDANGKLYFTNDFSE